MPCPPQAPPEACPETHNPPLPHPTFDPTRLSLLPPSISHTFSQRPQDLVGPFCCPILPLLRPGNREPEAESAFGSGLDIEVVKRRFCSSPPLHLLDGPEVHPEKVEVPVLAGRKEQVLPIRCDVRAKP
jgi:hypothetical protein